MHSVYFEMRQLSHYCHLSFFFFYFFTIKCVKGYKGLFFLEKNGNYRFKNND